MAKIQREYRDGSVDVRVSGRYARLMYAPDHPEYLGVEDLDLEELSRGQLKDRNGRFTGRPPKFLPRQIVDAMRAEHYARVNGLLEQSLSQQVKTMMEISKNRNVDPGVRLKAAIYVYERFMGKVPDKINVSAGQRVDDIVEDILYDVEEHQQTEIEKELAAAEEELKDGRTRRRRPAARRTQTRR